MSRTPPVSPVPITPTKITRNPKMFASTKEQSASSLLHCGSEPDLHTLAANITERKKRKHEGEKSDISEIISKMFSSFSNEQDKRFQELKTSIDLMSNKYDQFLSKINCLEKERQSDKLIIKELEDKLETLERKTRVAGIEIRNIPKQNGETKDTLVSEISKLGGILSVDINTNNIKDIYRLKSKDSSDPIVVDFTSVLIKDKVLKSVKTFNKSKQKGSKLNTNHLNANYSQKPIYISEALTHKTQRLYYLARQFRKSHGYSFCWTANGIVYLKNNEDSPHIRINNDADLEKLRINVKPL